MVLKGTEISDGQMGKYILPGLSDKWVWAAEYIVR